MKKIILLLALLALFIIPVNGYYYTLNFYSLTHNPVNAQTVYIGNRPQIPTTSAGVSSVWFPTSGTIEGVELMDYTGTLIGGIGGSTEALKYYIRINNQTDYLIDSVSSNAAWTGERRFTNSSYTISITAGDYFEIKKVNPTWVTKPTNVFVGGYVLFNSTVRGYVIPIMALTSSPTDNARNYMGSHPMAPATVPNTRKIFIPESGIITRIDIYDNSSGAQPGSAETIYYNLEKNGQTGSSYSDAPFAALSISSSARFFNGSAGQYNPPDSFQYLVSAGDYIEIYRQNPDWATNPLLNIVGGNIFVNTTGYFDLDRSEGYPLYYFATTVSPTTIEDRFFSNLLVAPSLTPIGFDRDLYILKGGTITKFNYYSTYTTAGQAEMGIYDGVIIYSNLTSTERRWNYDEKKFSTFYTTCNIGDSRPTYLVFGSMGTTKPAGMVISGWKWIEYNTVAPATPASPTTSDFSANISSVQKPATVQFFDQSNNTIPGITTYRWNFTDGGTGSDSTDINPIFTYTSPGSYTINHTVVNGAVTSKVSKFLTITGTAPSTVPNASFVITLTDTSINIPTSWQWNATNLTGDNVERTFSTSQNPIWNLTKSGNYLIKLIATNSFGSNSTNMTIGYGLTNPKVYFWNRTG